MIIGLTEIKNVQTKGTFANDDIERAERLILDVIIFLCCNKFMRLLRFLFRRKFDEQYDKLSKAYISLNAAWESLEEQWDVLEDYWNQIANEEYEEL